MTDLVQIEAIKNQQSFDSFLASSYNSDCELCIDDLSREITRFLKIDLINAIKYLKAVEDLFPFIPQKHHYRLTMMQARVALWRGEYTVSLEKYQTALEKVVKMRKFRTAAMIRKGMIEVYLYLGKYDEGILVGRKALEYFRKTKLDNDAGQVMTNIGNIYHRMDKNKQALQYYDKARKIFARHGGIPLAIVDYNRANIFANLNQLTQAKDLYLKAGHFYKESGMELAWQQAKYSIAYLLFLESRFTDALQLFEKVYDAFERLGDITSSIITQLDLAELNIQLNQYGSTIMLCELIIPRFKELHMTYEQGKAYYFAAVAKMELGDITQAEEFLKEAEKIFVQEKNDLWLGMIQFANIRICILNENYEQAVLASVAAGQFFQKSKDIRRQHDAEIAHVEALCKLGQHDKASSYVKVLLNSNITLEQKRKIFYIVGEYYFREKDYVSALENLKKAISIVEQMLTGLYQDEIKFFFAVDKYQIYTRVMDCYLQLGKVEESYLCNLQALSLVNEKIVSQRKIEQNVPPQLLQKIEELRSRLVKTYKFPKKGPRQIVSNDDIQKIEKQLWHYERKVRAYQYTGSSENQRSLKDFTSQKLSSDAVVINYYMSDSSIGAFVNSAEAIDFVPLPITKQELNGLVRKLQFVYENRISGSFFTSDDSSVSDAYLHLLYEKLIAPLKLEGSYKKIYLLTDAIFNQIPFQALKCSDSEYLKDRFELKIIINPSDLTGKSSRKIDFSKKKNAVFSVASEALPEVAVEGKKIQRKFSSAGLFTGEQATVGNFKKELNRSTGFLHIAAHASRSSENPLFSRILLSDGVFFPFDLFGQGVKPVLVTLSGCQTAAPGLNYGNTFSLAKAFYRAGCRYVLATLWHVDDKVTMKFMTTFYNELLKVQDIPTAYKNSLQTISRQVKDPAYWGAFVLIGN